MQQGKGDDLAFCPSFNFYSSNGSLAAIAAKVSREFIENDDDFEFSLVLGDEDVHVPADEVVFDGKIQQIFPIFNRDLLVNDDFKEAKNDDSATIRIPLEKLFIDDREEEAATSSCSSETDELETVPSGTYCVWRPNSKVVESSPSRCKKSKSTGSGSKRWNIRDLLRRCNSEGKEPIMFVTPKNRGEKTEKKNSGDGVKVVGKLKAGGEKSSSPHELFYIRNRAEKEVGKRKSYLPYRQDLVGLFASVNGMSKNFPF